MTTSVEDSLVSSSGIADFNQPACKVCRRNYGGHGVKLAKNTKKKLEKLSLSILGYCRNMVLQHGRPHEKGPAVYVDKNSSV